MEHILTTHTSPKAAQPPHDAVRPEGALANTQTLDQPEAPIASHSISLQADQPFDELTPQEIELAQAPADSDPYGGLEIMDVETTVVCMKLAAKTINKLPMQVLLAGDINSSAAWISAAVAYLKKKLAERQRESTIIIR